MSAFTKGPWLVKWNPVTVAVLDRDGSYITENVRQLPNQEANARLIAAAPEMYEALKPFAEFAARWEANPLRGVADDFYTIHSGEHEAKMRLSDCRRALELLAKIDARQP